MKRKKFKIFEKTNRNLRNYILITLIGLILLFLFSSVIVNKCGSPCDKHSILNPFGISFISYQSACAAVCVERPYPIFYWIFDLLLITFILYRIYFIINYKNKKC